MENKPVQNLKNGDQCLVTSKTGHITVEQKNGVRLKTLGKNVVVKNEEE